MALSVEALRNSVKATEEFMRVAKVILAVEEALSAERLHITYYIEARDVLDAARRARSSLVLAKLQARFPYDNVDRDQPRNVR